MSRIGRHVVDAIGEILLQPFAEQIAQLERQPQDYMACAFDAGDRRGIQDAFDFGVVDRGG
jgi:hypothetical protein